MDFEITEKEVTREFIEIGGKELYVGTVLEFLEEIEGSDGFFSYGWKVEYEEIAEVLIDEDIVDTTISGSWYSKDDEAISELREEIRDEVYE